MALIFDGVGRVQGFVAIMDGDFSITVPPFKVSALFGVILGDDNSTDTFLQPRNNEFRFRMSSGGFTLDLPPIPVDTLISDCVITRVGTLVTFTANGNTVTGNNSGRCEVRAWGAYNNGASRLQGEISGQAEFVGTTNGTITHDFDGTAGSETLIDTTSAQNGTLSEFTTGGFNGAPVSADPTIALTSVGDFSCEKRNDQGRADFTIAGDITNLPTDASVEYQLDGGTWLTLDANPSAAFSGTVTITDQQDLLVRLSTNTGVTDSANKLTAALVIVAWWQSNEAGRAASTQNNALNDLDANAPTPIMFRGGVFKSLSDPVGQNSTDGSTWPRIAVLYANAGIPVCIINVAVGGTGIERWKPSANDLYSRITNAVTAANIGVSFTTSIGGEANVSTAQATIESDLNETINALASLYGTEHYLSYIPRTYTNNEDANLRAAFDNVIANNSNCLFGGDLETIDLTTSGDGTHLNSSAQINQAAQIRYDAFTATQSTPQEESTMQVQSDAVSIVGGDNYRFSTRFSADVVAGSADFNLALVFSNGDVQVLQTASDDVPAKSINTPFTAPAGANSVQVRAQINNQVDFEGDMRLAQTDIFEV